LSLLRGGSSFARHYEGDHAVDYSHMHGPAGDSNACPANGVGYPDSLPYSHANPVRHPDRISHWNCYDHTDAGMLHLHRRWTDH
jgi:hypothetical protein